MVYHHINSCDSSYYFAFSAKRCTKGITLEVDSIMKVALWRTGIGNQGGLPW
ncbi:hypothetical protein [Shewanella sp. NIFS-20-20]|uniref:hypothetical protein n=1 Tax=Shewanella sp. NIFS-20-20 TaxID=2853806 RepID=UPI001C47102D|nr:hypothetical protein [Shewanella sp. NIFS-20-20]MBV7316899.1 hypothetical protein [Shewanella sp. NIFS-20-20]